MRYPKSQQQELTLINKRAIEAIDYLVSSGVATHEKTLLAELGVEQKVLYRIKKEPERYRITLWLLYKLATRYAISAEWLITGNGKMR